jgi:hypothetical protein
MPIQSNLESSDNGSTSPSEYERAPRHDGHEVKNEAYREGAKMAEESLEEAFEDTSDESEEE